MIDTTFAPESQWDDALFDDLLNGKLGDIGYNLNKLDGGSIVLIHARHHTKSIKEINKHLSVMDWCLVVLIGDEGSVFPWEELKHPKMKIWVMDPRPQRHEELRYIPNGYPPQLRKFKGSLDKEDAFFFSGQVNHKKREEMYERVKDLSGGEVHATEGFTKGMPHQEYYEKMAKAKMALCPAGPETPDTFRVWEALELGCVPIVDLLPSRKKYPNGFWENMLGEKPPFEFVNEWEGVEKLLPEVLKEWKVKANLAMAWYKRYKRQLVRNLRADLYHLTRVEPEQNKITTLLVTSCIPTHPDTKIIDNTIESIRTRLPDSEIVIMFDGLRMEQRESRPDYEEFVRKMLIKTKDDPQIIPLVFQEHTHQVGMTREALKLVDTPFIQFMEHDTPLVGDIPYDECLKELDNLDLIRFSHEASILDPHKHMMLDKEPIGEHAPHVRTVQYSARPHLAHTSFYKRLLCENFPPETTEFIEDRLYSVILTAYELKGLAGWQDYKMAIYHPEGDSIKRSEHTDGRLRDDGWREPKYDGVGS